MDVEQFFTFAAALNTSPAFLLTPHPTEKVRVVPAHSSHGFRVGEWVRGEHPLALTGRPGLSHADQEAFWANAPPDLRTQRRIDSHPAVAAMTSLLATARSAIENSDSASAEVDLAVLARSLREEAARVAAYVELLAGEVTASDPAGVTDKAKFELNPGPVGGEDDGERQTAP
jgi:hypothetical protein